MRFVRSDEMFKLNNDEDDSVPAILNICGGLVGMDIRDLAVSSGLVQLLGLSGRGSSGKK